MSYSMSKGIKVLKQNSLFDEFQINGKIDKNTLAIKLKYKNNNIDKSDIQKIHNAMVVLLDTELFDCYSMCCCHIDNVIHIEIS